MRVPKALLEGLQFSWFISTTSLPVSFNSWLMSLLSASGLIVRKSTGKLRKFRPISNLGFLKTTLSQMSQKVIKWCLHHIKMCRSIGTFQHYFIFNCLTTGWIVKKAHIAYKFPIYNTSPLPPVVYSKQLTVFSICLFIPW